MSVKAGQAHTREDQYRQTRTAVDSQYPSQTRASPEVAVSLRPGVVDHKELHDPPDNQVHREQPAHSHCGKPQQLPSPPRRTFPARQNSTPFAGPTRLLPFVRGPAAEAPLARQVPSPGAPADARHDQPLRTAVVDSRPAEMPCGGSATGTLEVDSAGDSVSTGPSSPETTSQAEDRQEDGIFTCSPIRCRVSAGLGYTACRPCRVPYSKKYSNAVGRERLR